MTASHSGAGRFFMEVGLADERIVNDVRVYRDSAGAWRESPILDGASALPSSDMAVQGTGSPLGYEQITNDRLAAPVGLSPPAGAVTAFLQSNGTQGVRFRDDIGAPTATLGQRIDSNGGTLTYSGDLTKLRFMREASGAVLDILYYG